MPRVFIPPPLRDLTNDIEVVEVEGNNVRQVVESLEQKYPGIKSRLCDGDQLKAELSVAIGSSVNSLRMLAKVAEDDEVHFLPIIGGG